MYKKSVNAGSQSAISNRSSIPGDMNGNGHENEVTETLNVKIVTNTCESTDNVETHNGTCHSDQQKYEQEKSCLHNSNVVRFHSNLIISQMPCVHLETGG